MIHRIASVCLVLLAANVNAQDRGGAFGLAFHGGTALPLLPSSFSDAYAVSVSLGGEVLYQAGDQTAIGMRISYLRLGLSDGAGITQWVGRATGLMIESRSTMVIPETENIAFLTIMAGVQFRLGNGCSKMRGREEEHAKCDSRIFG